MSRVERVVVDGRKGEICIVNCFKFDKHKPATSHFTNQPAQVRLYGPFALINAVVPWHEDIIWLHLNALTRKFLADFCEKFVLFRPADYRDTIDDKNVVQGIITLNLISANQSDFKYNI